MFKFKGTLLCLALVALLGSISSEAWCQTPSKAETKLYTKTIGKKTIAQYNKFLAKYPSSVYAEEILTLRDSTEFSRVDRTDAAAVGAFLDSHRNSPLKESISALFDELCKCPVSEEAAERIAASAVDGYNPERMAAIAYRDINRDLVLVLDVMPSSEYRSMDLYIIACAQGKSDENGKGTWEQQAVKKLEKYCLDPAMDRTILDSGLSISTVAGRKMIEASYINSGVSDFNIEWCSVVFTPDGSEQSNLMFYGRNMLGKEPAKGEYRIEGQSPETLSLTGMSQETAWLLQKMNENERLKHISEADAMTDEALSWWLSKNPKAETTATSVRPGTLRPESSLVQAFQTAKGKEVSKSYIAALMDVRGYTVVVAYSKSSKEYNLVWAEPVCTNKSRNKYIKTIYIDSDGTTLNLFYYQARTSFKIKINLSSKKLSRQR